MDHNNEYHNLRRGMRTENDYKVDETFNDIDSFKECIDIDLSAKVDSFRLRGVKRVGGYTSNNPIVIEIPISYEGYSVVTEFNRRLKQHKRRVRDLNHDTLRDK